MRKPVKIILTDDNVKVVQKSDDNEEVSRNIAVHELIAAMSDDVILRTGIMSPGIREYYVYGEREVIVVECPPKIREAKFMGHSGRIKIPFPPLLLFFGLLDGKMNNSAVFAIKEPFTDPSMTLYSFPLGDADPHSGTICWGHNSANSNYTAMNKVASYGVSNVQGLVVRFFSGKFNDNFTGNNSCFTSPKDAKRRISRASGLVNYLKGKTSFPLDILKKAGIKYEEVIKNVGDNRSVQYH